MDRARQSRVWPRWRGIWPAISPAARSSSVPIRSKIRLRTWTALSQCPGVSVDSTGPVQPWIFRAAAVIQRSCSTAIDAALAGVPTLSPQWIPAPAVVSVAEAVSRPCASYAALAAELHRILAATRSEPAEPAAADPLLTDWFFRCDGLSHHRVGEVVSAHLPASRTVSESRCRRRMYGIGPGTARLRQRAAARAPILSPAFARVGLPAPPDTRRRAMGSVRQAIRGRRRRGARVDHPGGHAAPGPRGAPDRHRDDQ